MTFLLLALMTACTDDGTVQDSTSDSGTNTISCPEPDPDVIPVGTINEECCARPSEVEIGNGERCHQSFPEEGCVTMVHGPQGGWHIWQAIETYNLGVVGDMTWSITLGESGPVVSATEYRVGLIADGSSECRKTFSGMIGYLDVSSLGSGGCDSPPELLAYREVCLTVTLEDETGVPAEHHACAEALPWADDPTSIDESCWP